MKKDSYSVSSVPLEIGPELTMDYPFDNPFCFVATLVNELVPWFSWRLGGAPEIATLRLRLRLQLNKRSFQL